MKCGSRPHIFVLLIFITILGGCISGYDGIEPSIEPDEDQNGQPNPDEYENDHGGDVDNDGLNLKEETELGTDPYIYDTDMDNMGDGFEQCISKTDPLSPNHTYAIYFVTLPEETEYAFVSKRALMNKSGILEENIHSFYHEDATILNYDSILEELSTLMTMNDVLLVYINGHGNISGKFHISGADEQAIYVDNYVFVESLTKANLKVGKIIIMFDSCYGGTLIDKVSKKGLELPLLIISSCPDNSLGTGFHGTFFLSDPNNILFVNIDKDGNGHISLYESLNHFSVLKGFDIETLHYDPHDVIEKTYIGDINHPCD